MMSIPNEQSNMNKGKEGNKNDVEKKMSDEGKQDSAIKQIGPTMSLSHIGGVSMGQEHTAVPRMMRPMGSMFVQNRPYFYPQQSTNDLYSMMIRQPSLYNNGPATYQSTIRQQSMDAFNMFQPDARMMSSVNNNIWMSQMTNNNQQSFQDEKDVYWHYNPGPELYSRKVFVGGLPIDIDEDELSCTFSRFGPLVVDWPHKNETRSYYPPKGYVFLIFEHEPSVQALVESCYEENEKLYLCLSSPTIKEKPVQIRPWRLADADFVVEASMSLDHRKTVFIGGVPRPLKAEMAHIMDRLYGGVCYAGIDADPELKYPKGAGRVAFNNQQSYIAAISARFVQLTHGDIDKRVEVKPYVLDEQMCDECQGQRCGLQFAPFFCANVSCLQYYCEHCWSLIHSRHGREYHKPLIKESLDIPSRLNRQQRFH